VAAGAASTAVAKKRTFDRSILRLNSLKSWLVYFVLCFYFVDEGVSCSSLQPSRALYPLEARKVQTR
jgi:hypothetical protein